MRTLLEIIVLGRPIRVMAIMATGLCLALGLAYAAFAQSVPPDDYTSVAPVQKPSDLLTATVFLPIIMRPLDVRFTTIGYDCCPANGCPELCEHIHFRNFGTSAVNITGWRIYSPATGDSYPFPTASAPPTSTGKEITLNTHYTNFVDNVYIFNWNLPGKDEWPSAGGVAYLYDANNNVVATCNYTPTFDGTGNAPCR